MILTRLPITDIEKRLIWAQDRTSGSRRPARRHPPGQRCCGSGVRLSSPSGSCRPRRAHHVGADVPALGAYFAGPRLVGGDFNDDSSSPPIAALRQEFVDAWAVKGSGGGGTHSHDGKHYRTRIDYLWSAGGLEPTSAFVPEVALSDHRPVVASFSLGQGTSATIARAATTATPATSRPTSAPVATSAGRLHHTGARGRRVADRAVYTDNYRCSFDH